MIDYLEDLLEEDLAVELTGDPLTPVGRRKVPLFEEDESLLRDMTSPGNDQDGGTAAANEDASSGRAGSPSWVEEAADQRPGAVRLLAMLSRAAQAAGRVQQQGKPVTVTLTGENTRSGQMDLEAVDRAVQRDARRYDGGFPLY